MKTLVISDIHIGRKDSNIRDFYEFIKDKTFDRIIFNGDIFDQFAMWKDKFKLYKKEHKQFVKKIRKKLKEEKTEIVFNVGNHDIFALFLIPFGFLFGAKIRKRFISDYYLIEHGDWVGLYTYFKKDLRKNKSYVDKWQYIAKKKNKKVIVGHSHMPKIKGDVIDEGDWTKHNSYVIIEKTVKNHIKLVRNHPNDYYE